MRTLLLFSLLASALASSPATFNSTSVQPGEFAFSIKVLPNTEFHWTAQPAADGTTLLTGAIVSKCTGWVAFGIGSSMSNADTFIAAVSGGSVNYQDGYTSGQSETKPDSRRGGVDDITRLSGEEIGGTTTVKFEKRFPAKDGAGDRAIKTSGSQSMIFAIQRSKDDFDEKHSSKTAKSVNLLTGKFSSISDNAQIIHGVLMALAWGFFVAVAMLLAFAFKHIGHLWYQLHTAFQITAVALVIAALIIIVRDVGSSAVSTFHGGVGITSVILMFMQPFIGFYANYTWDPNRLGPPIWPDLCHVWIGRVALLCASAAVISGILVYGTSAGYIAIYVVWLAFLLMIGLYQVHIVKRVAPNHGTELKP